ncbi:tetratricopeptide repeat protein [Myxococcota bacterium]|nr:tetratricopeptide repeat protein [Myxococcota bacterium]
MMRSALPRRLAALLLSLVALLALPGTASARRTFTGENHLDVPRPLMKATQEGLEMIYRREYVPALDHFEGISKDFPDSPVGHVGRALAFQSMMLENFDLSHEAAYARERDAAYALVNRALKSTQRQAWNHFLYAVVVGLDGIHEARRGDMLTGLNKGWDAVEAMKKARRLDPDFADPELGIGIYNYWRTALTEGNKQLPKFGDHRAEGIAQMTSAQQRGFLTWAAAGFTLAFTYWEDKKPDQAVAECEKLLKEYPESVITRMLLGRVHAKADRVDAALAQYREIQRLAPQNQRVLFLIGDLLFKKKDDRGAEEHFMKYLATRPMELAQASAWFRIGQIRERAHDVEGALGAYQAALQLAPKYSQAEKRLLALKERKTGKAALPVGANVSAPAGGKVAPAPGVPAKAPAARLPAR